MQKKIILFLFLLCTSVLSLMGQQTVGLFTKTAGSLDGYVLFAPVQSDTTYLIDKCGKRIHQWASAYTPGLSVHLLPDGSIMRSAAINNPVFNGAGSSGGLIEHIDWNGNVLWSYLVSDSNEIQNHDIFPMPNGNMLVAVWDKHDVNACLLAGRNPSLLGGNGIWSAKVVELEPVGTNQANIVWVWRLWDHLVQDYDSAKSNYGVIADHPELINLNYTGNNPNHPDWIHLNSVTYNPVLNQVMISSHDLSEVWILDHSTTTAEAASHAGGVYGKGGDFLYRWGNPAAYNRGTVNDQKLFLQHSPEWIPSGFADANNIMIFNNGNGRPGGNSSSVDIIAPPIDSTGNYTLNSGQAFGPATSYWSYAATNPADFYTMAMGGAQRLSNGNTLICEAMHGNFFEIDSAKNVVWQYINPVKVNTPVAQGTPISQNGSYRSLFFDPSFSGFAGKNMTPGGTIEINPIPSGCTMLAGVYQTVQENRMPFSVVNPFAGNIMLHTQTAVLKANILLVDITGRLQQTWEINNAQNNQSVSLPLVKNTAPGIYFLQVHISDQSYAIKLIHLQE